MIAGRRSRWVRTAAEALVAAALMSGTGCGSFCLVNSHCDTGAGECCSQFRCRVPCGVVPLVPKERVADGTTDSARLDFADLLVYLFPPMK